MSRLRSWALPSIAVWLLLLSVAGAARAAGSETFRDQFDAISYNGNNGSADWSASWIEFGDSGGATSGKVKVVVDSECAAGGCGYMSGSGATTAGISRMADLSNASDATLSYSYRRTKIGNAPAVVLVAASSDGGVGWTTVATHMLDESDSSPQTASMTLKSFISDVTAVRFVVVATPGQGGRFHFDDVQIAASFPDPTTTTTTTTTTSTTTTSSPPPTTTSTTSTTTTPPVTSTTTTTAPPASTTTTTLRPPTSTSTLPPTPTSTLPGPAPTSTSLAPPVTPSSTSTAPVALPPGGSDPVPTTAPFPVNPSRHNGSVGSDRAVQFREGVNFVTTNGNVSSIVHLPNLSPLVIQTPLQAGRAGVADGDLIAFVAYLWPAVLPLAAVALAEVLAPLRARRRTS